MCIISYIIHMIDIDITNNDDGTIDIFESNNAVLGNRALVNRFQIVFLTNSTSVFYSDSKSPKTDQQGGDASKFIGTPHALATPASIAASMIIAIERTVKVIKTNQSKVRNAESRLAGASLVSIDIVDGMIYGVIDIAPEKREPGLSTIYNAAIRKV